MLKAIIFDMDGLMVDSEPFHYKAFAEVLQTYDQKLTEKEHSDSYVGVTDIESARMMIAHYNLSVPLEELVKQKQAKYKMLIANNIKPKQGLLKLLRQLQESGYKKAIASNSVLDEIKIMINTLHIQQYIDIYCSAQEVKFGKPAPDLYLLTSKKLEVDPEECLVLEDSPSGIKAAKAAGMKSFAIPSRETRRKNFSDASEILRSLNDVFINLDNKTVTPSF